MRVSYEIVVVTFLGVVYRDFEHRQDVVGKVIVESCASGESVAGLARSTSYVHQPRKGKREKRKANALI